MAKIQIVRNCRICPISIGVFGQKHGILQDINSKPHFHKIFSKTTMLSPTRHLYFLIDNRWFLHWCDHYAHWLVQSTYFLLKNLVAESSLMTSVASRSNKTYSICCDKFYFTFKWRFWRKSLNILTKELTEKRFKDKGLFWSSQSSFPVDLYKLWWVNFDELSYLPAFVIFKYDP